MIIPHILKTHASRPRSLRYFEKLFRVGNLTFISGIFLRFPGGDLLKIKSITLTVKDYDEALDFYVDKMGFDKVTDKKIAPGMRWVTVAPKGAKETAIQFEKASNASEKQKIGKQLGNMLVQLETENFDKTYKSMKEKGVKFVEEPKVAPWGKQAVFSDLYGNLFDLVESSQI